MITKTPSKTQRIGRCRQVVDDNVAVPEYSTVYMYREANANAFISLMLEPRRIPYLHSFALVFLLVHAKGVVQQIVLLFHVASLKTSCHTRTRVPSCI